MDGGSIAPGSFRRTGTHRDTTLGEHGWRTVVGGQSLVITPVTLRHLARIGRLVDLNPRYSRALGTRVLRYLALAVEETGGVDLRAMTLEQRVVALRDWRIGDLMYAGFLRLAQLDDGRHRVDVEEHCPQCRGLLPDRVVVDLNQVRLTVWDTPPAATYRLRRPVPLMGLSAETITLESPRLQQSLDNLTFEELNHHDLLYGRWVAAAISAINGAPNTCSADRLLDTELQQDDWAGLCATLDAVLAAPAAALPWVHEACGSKLAVAVDWVTAFFTRARG